MIQLKIANRKQVCKVYSKYKDTLNVIINGDDVFTIPLYYNDKIDSQCTTFIISGTIMDYKFSIKRNVYTDRRYVQQGNGNYFCESNKRQFTPSSGNRYEAYTRYTFNNLKTGDDYREIDLDFCFKEEYQQDILDTLLTKAANKALTKRSKFVSVDNTWQAKPEA
jgi:hypothetical protein